MASAIPRRGDYAGARHVLERTAERILQYSGSDRRLMQIVQELQQDFWQYETQMSPMMLKQAFYSAEAMTKFRGAGGKARRRGGGA